MATKMTLLSLYETVDAAGTAQPLSATALLVTFAAVTAKKAAGVNTGNVYVGTSSVDKSTDQQRVLAPGDYWEIPLSGSDHYIDLSELYVDADTNDDGVFVHYFEGTG